MNIHYFKHGSQWESWVIISNVIRCCSMGLLPGSLNGPWISNKPSQKERIIFQPSFFRGKLAVKLRGCMFFFGTSTAVHCRNLPDWLSMVGFTVSRAVNSWVGISTGLPLLSNNTGMTRQAISPQWNLSGTSLTQKLLHLMIYKQLNNKV